MSCHPISSFYNIINWTLVDNFRGNLFFFNVFMDFLLFDITKYKKSLICLKKDILNVIVKAQLIAFFFSFNRLIFIKSCNRLLYSKTHSPIHR